MDSAVNARWRTHSDWRRAIAIKIHIKLNTTDFDEKNTGTNKEKRRIETATDSQKIRSEIMIHTACKLIIWFMRRRNFGYVRTHLFIE